MTAPGPAPGPVPGPVTGSHLAPDLAGQMRAEFDAGFARAVQAAETDLIDLLELQVGDRHLEIPVTDIAQVVARPVLTPLPSRAPALHGIASVGDLLVAGYDLGVLLGLPASNPGWLLTAAAEPGVGVTLDRVMAHRRVPRQGARTLPLLAMTDLVGLIRNVAGQPKQSNRSQI